MKGKNSAERISQRVLYVIVALTAIVFLAFYLIDFNEPFVGNSAFNAPLLTDLLLAFMWLLFGVAVVVAVMAMVKGWKASRHSAEMDNGIPVKKISYITYGATFALLIITFALGSNQAMMVNGERFSDGFWLRVSDMFVLTSLFMLVIAAGVVAFGATRYYRKARHRRTERR